MYYLLEYKIEDTWKPAGFVLVGDIHTHTGVIEVLQKQFANDFRCKRISQVEAIGYATLGLKVMHAPN
jgi:hypothetical protein